MRLGKGSRKSLFLHVNGVQYGSKTLCCHFTRAADDDRLSFVRLVVTFYGWGGYLRSMCRMRGENWCHTNCWLGLRLPNVLYPSAVNFARCGRSECKLMLWWRNLSDLSEGQLCRLTLHLEIRHLKDWCKPAQKIDQLGWRVLKRQTKPIVTDCQLRRASDWSTVEDEFFTSHKKESCPLSSNKSSFNVPCWLPQNYRHNPFI